MTYKPYSSAMKVAACYIDDVLVEKASWTTEEGAYMLLIGLYDPFQRGH